VPVRPIAIADIGLLERRRVVDAIAGHRDHRPCLPKRFDDAQLVLGIDACVDRHAGDRLQAVLGSQLVELGAGDGAAVGADSELVRNHRRGARVIAGDHQGANAGAAGARDCISGFRPWRIDDAYQTGEHEVLLDVLVRLVHVPREHLAGHPPGGHTQRPQRLAGECLVGLENLAPPFIRERPPFFTDQLAGAAGEQHVGCAFREDNAAILLGVTVQRAHQLPLG